MMAAMLKLRRLRDSCHCARMPARWSCYLRATGEDLLCDVCRDGCYSIYEGPSPEQATGTSSHHRRQDVLWAVDAGINVHPPLPS